MPIHAPLFWGRALGHISSKWCHSSPWPPKGPSLGWTTSFEPLTANIGHAVRVGRWNEKKRQDRTVKKSQKGYISLICGESPTEAMYIKICLVGDVLDEITCFKFQNEIFQGVMILQGVEFSIFLLIFEWILQQCSATALPVMGAMQFNKSLRCRWQTSATQRLSAC